MAPTSWQDHWKLIEDSNGDLFGEYMEKVSSEIAQCRWCCANIRFTKSGITSLKLHSGSKKHQKIANGRKGRDHTQPGLVSVSRAERENNEDVNDSRGTVTKTSPFILVPFILVDIFFVGDAIF